MNIFLKAGSGEGVFWLVFAVIWIIGKAISSSKNNASKKRSATTPVRPQKQRLPQKDLQTFLESLTTVKPVATVTAPPPLPVNTPEALPETVSELPPDNRNSHHTDADPYNVSITRCREQASNVSAVTRGLIIDSSGMSMPDLGAGLSQPRLETNNVERPNLRSRKQLRRSMLTHIILSPALALEKRV